jgi:hypothetical protein
MGKKHEQGEENGLAASKVGRKKKKKKEKVGRWREEEIRVLRREEDRRRETLSTHSIKCNHTKAESVTKRIRDKFMKPPPQPASPPFMIEDEINEIFTGHLTYS